MKGKKLSTILISMLLCCAFFLTGCGGDSLSKALGKRKVTVSFDYNFETDATPLASIEVGMGKTYGTLPTVTIENAGYVFAGWNTRADGNGKEITKSSVVNFTAGNHTLYAKWQGAEFTVSYDLGGGNINGATTIASKKVTYGQIYGMFAIPSNPQKNMAKFDGWYTNPQGNGEPVDIDSLVRTKGDHTLYAIFRDIRFNYDFEDKTEIRDFYSYGRTLSYEIAGEEGSKYLEISNYSADPAGRLVLDSEFTAGTTIEIDAEFVGEIDPVELNDSELDYGNKKVKAGMFCYGANIDGSNINSGALGVPGEPGTPDIVNKWYWGQGARSDPWEKSIWNDGKLKFTVQILEHCYGLQFMMEFGKRRVSATPDANGVDYDTNSELWKNNKWRIHSIKINYKMPVPDLEAGTEVTVNFDTNSDGEIANPASITAIACEEIGELPTLPNRNGYEFVGWNTQPNGKGKTYDEERILLTPDPEITLYAIWEGETVKVSFDLCGGTYNGQTTVHYEFVQLGTYYTEDILVRPSKANMSFGGWYLNPEGNGEPIVGTSICKKVGDHTLYAVYVDKVENINCFDFSSPTHAMYFTSLTGLGLSYKSDSTGNYLEVTNNTAQAHGNIAIMKPLTKGMSVDVDLEFIGEVDSIDYTGDDKIKAGAFFYGAKADGNNLDTYNPELGVPGEPGTSDEVNKWYWGQGARNDPWERGVWNDGHISYTIKILEDCYGLNIMMEFGRKKVGGVDVLDSTLWENNKWRINSIVVNVPGIATEYSFDLNGGNVNGATTLAKVQTVTGQTYGNLPTPKKDGYMFAGWFTNPQGTGKAISSTSLVKNTKPHTLYAVYREMRLTYDFTSADQIASMMNKSGAAWEIVTEGGESYLKVKGTTSKEARFAIMDMFLPAGTKVEVDVEFVGETDGKIRTAGIFLYGADQDGNNINSHALGNPNDSGTPQEVKNWYWGQGQHNGESSSVWKDGKFTIKGNILEDSYGIYFWAQMGETLDGYWKIKAIRITLP